MTFEEFRAALLGPDGEAFAQHVYDGIIDANVIHECVACDAIEWGSWDRVQYFGWRNQTQSSGESAILCPDCQPRD